MEDPFQFYRIILGQITENEFLRFLQPGVKRNRLNDGVAIKYALEYKYFKVAEFLLRNGVTVDNYVIRKVAMTGNVNLLELALCSENTSAVNKVFSFPVFLLDWINIPNAVSICRALLKYGFDPNDMGGDPPLNEAIKSGNEDIIELMLEYGADPTKKGFTVFSSPLIEAFKSTVSVHSIGYIIEYAAVKDVSLTESQFREIRAHSRVDCRVRSFWAFARRCIKEIMIMKDLNVRRNRVCLLKFILLKDESLKEFLKDPQMTRDVLKALSLTSLPVYSTLIIKKLDRKSVMDCFDDLSLTKDVPLNYVCALNIFNFLCKEDLINLWMAIN